MAGYAAFVRAHAALAAVPLVPEVVLYQAEDAFALWEATERQEGQEGRERQERQALQPPPFWAFPWPGGVALARYLLDRPDTVAGRAVLDIGSGSGLAAIAAALAGATSVLASELDPVAVAAIDLNARANGVTVRVAGDVLDGAGEDADLVLAGDVWYERRLAGRVAGLLGRARAHGAEVIAADVGRKFLPRELMRALASYQVPVIADLEDAAVKRAEVLTLR